MIKRIFTLFCIAFLLLSISACGSSANATEPTPPPQTLPAEKKLYDPTGYKVNNPLEYPNYTFEEAPSNLTWRLTAVQAFKDLLSVRWSTPVAIKYNKTGPVSDKTFQHAADVTYAGTIYSNASTGLFQFLEFYDFETGRLRYPGSIEEMKEALGASCADAMIWGLTTVCNSITGPYYPVTMVYQNGYLPVGDYTYDFTITSYNMMPTQKIVEQNGKEVMLDAYTKVRPGDMFTSTPDNHGMMAISIPSVFYTADGEIDMERSYINIQDQRGGQGRGFYEVEEGNEVIQYSGRTTAKFTFKQLYDKAYIPVTTAEFAGLKEYEAATASISAECTTVSDLTTATVSSNYPLAVVNIVVADKFGNKTVIGRQLFNGADETGVPREFALSEMECLKDFESDKYNTPSYTVKVEVVPSSGDRIIVAEIPIK